MSIETIEIPLQSATVTPFIVQGDTIPEWTVEYGSGDGVDLTGATIKMQIYWSGNKVIDISNGSGITIDTTLKFTVDERSKDEDVLPDGIGIGDLEVLDSGGDRLTYFRVKYDITKQYTE